MIEFGKTLREAREAKGYTIGQVAESTRLMSSMIEDLETEDFSRIAAPIYGRGFVKLYCEAVGIDSKPMVAEFMEIFNGNRDIAIRERPAATPAPTPKLQVPAEPESAPEPQPAAPSESAAAAPEPERQPPTPNSLFDFDPPPTRQTVVSTQPTPEPAPQPPRLSRYSAPVEATRPTREQGHARFRSLPHIPPNVWKLATLAVGALLVVWLLLIGVRALYRATTDGNRPAVAARPAETRSPTKATAKTEAQQAQPPAAKAKRTPQKIPALYMD